MSETAAGGKSERGAGKASDLAPDTMMTTATTTATAQGVAAAMTAAVAAAGEAAAGAAVAVGGTALIHALDHHQEGLHHRLSACSVMKRGLSNLPALFQRVVGPDLPTAAPELQSLTKQMTASPPLFVKRCMAATATAGVQVQVASSAVRAVVVVVVVVVWPVRTTPIPAIAAHAALGTSMRLTTHTCASAVAVALAPRAPIRHRPAPTNRAASQSTSPCLCFPHKR